MENLGTVPLTNVQVTDDLTATFPLPVTFMVTAGPTVTGTLAANNSGYDGVSGGDTDLLNAGSSSLAVGASWTISFTVQIDPMGETGPFFNTALALGDGPTGTTVTDPSDDGPSTDPDDDGDPGGPDEDDPTVINLGVVIEIPTLSEWALILFTLLLAGAALRIYRR